MLRGPNRFQVRKGCVLCHDCVAGRPAIIVRRRNTTLYYAESVTYTHCVTLPEQKMRTNLVRTLMNFHMRWLQRDEGTARKRFHVQSLPSYQLTSSVNRNEFRNLSPALLVRTGYTQINKIPYYVGPVYQCPSGCITAMEGSRVFRTCTMENERYPRKYGTTKNT
jgi:hypothetical protein